MIEDMRINRSPYSLLLFFFSLFFLSSSVAGSHIAQPESSTSTAAPSASMQADPAGAGPFYHPAAADMSTVEEACHLFGETDYLRRLYPVCAAALRSAPESRNATLPELAVLATALVQRDAAAAVRSMEALRSRGEGGDQEELARCLSDYGMFLSVMRGMESDLRRGGHPGIQYDLVTVQTYVDCRWMKRDPVERQQEEVLALLWAAYGICNKYCSSHTTTTTTSPPPPRRCNFF